MTSTVNKGMLKRVWQESDYCADVFHVTRSCHIEYLERANKNFENFLETNMQQVIVSLILNNNHMKVLTIHCIDLCILILEGFVMIAIC